MLDSGRTVGCSQMLTGWRHFAMTRFQIVARYWVVEMSSFGEWFVYKENR